MLSWKKIIFSLKSLFKRLSCENKSRGTQGLDVTKATVRVLKAKEEMKPVIMDKNASVVSELVREARTGIALIVINPITLLVIALSQR